MDSLGEGGAEQNLLTMIRYARGVDHELAWLFDDERLRKAFSTQVVRLIPLNCAHGIDHLFAALRLAQAIRSDPPDLIHAKLIRSQLVARLAAALIGVPIITTWESVSYNERMYIELGRRGLVLKQVTRVLDALTGLRDRHFIAVSHEVATNNARKLGVSPSRVSVVYNAIEPSRMVNPSAEELTVLRVSLGVSDGPIVLSVGRVADEKNYPTAVRAMPLVLARHPNAVWLIAGGGERHEVEELARALSVEQSVRFLGARSDIPQLLRLADLFVSPSHYEGFGIALMEALAAGLPAVASRIPTSLELAEGIDTVRFFDTTDPVDLARAVNAALAEKHALKRHAATYASQIQARFAPNVMIEQFLSIAYAAALPSRR